VEKYLAETDWDAWESAPDDFEDIADENALKLARHMKSDGMTVEQISKYTGLSVKEIENL